jgi:hypothetical protein
VALLPLPPTAGGPTVTASPLAKGTDGMTLVEKFARALRDAGDQAGMAAVLCAMEQEAAVSRACRLALAAIAAEGRLSPEGKAIAMGYVRAAQEHWPEVPSAPMVVEAADGTRYTYTPAGAAHER